jgi:KamA family protein
MPQWRFLTPDIREAIDVVSRVLPFRTNRYVMDELIDWDRIPDDPMFQLTFPQRGMLSEDDYEAIATLVRRDAPDDAITAVANRIRLGLNPQPGGQKTRNVPVLDGKRIPGVQHKYRETVLFFPKRGQTCHAYCSYCFRWAQFVRIRDIRFAADTSAGLVEYLRRHPEVSDVLITGGDPMTMRSAVLREYIEPLLNLDHIQTIRIGTKSPATWPHRFVAGADADDALRVFEAVAVRGKELALMAHYTHPVELSTDVAKAAIRRIRSTGAIIRMQSPIARHVNDRAEVWADLWRAGVQLGCIPYYMFVVRDTGARDYFELPLARSWEIFQEAYRQVSGLARTVRGPSMSAMPGKVHILGIAATGGRQVFVLEYLQARDPKLVRRPFLARFDPDATWFDDLEPAAQHDVEFFPDYGEGNTGSPK